MANYRSVLNTSPENLSALAELARCAYISADICFTALREMQGYYEIRGNEAALLETGKRNPSARLIDHRMRTLRERIPRLRDESLELWKEFPR